MPRRSKGPRLWLRPARHDADGKLTHESAWVILDGSVQRGTGCGPGQLAQAEAALRDYLAGKHTRAVSTGTRDPSEILISDVLALYVRDVVGEHARPHQTAIRIKFLHQFWRSRKLSDVTGATCREYAAQRDRQTSARRELEDLRAAINHHRREGLHDRIVSVVLPPKSPPRERWLTRHEAARLIMHAWRYREQQNYRATDRHTRRHVARFVLVALYTGSRAGVVCSASFKREDRFRGAWVDVDNGVLHRRGEGERQTKKRKPSVRLPPELVAHLRRWRARGQHYVVEWRGKPVENIHGSFGAAVRESGIGAGVTPHTLRHTAATWLMQNGTDLWEAAGYLGMTVQTLERVYGHHNPDHHPPSFRGRRRNRGD